MSDLTSSYNLTFTDDSALTQRHTVHRVSRIYKSKFVEAEYII